MISHEQGDEFVGSLPLLDGRAGPARRISVEKASALVQAALDAAPGDREHLWQRRSFRMAVAAALVLGLLGVASAGVYRWRRGVARERPSDGRLVAGPEKDWDGIEFPSLQALEIPGNSIPSQYPSGPTKKLIPGRREAATPRESRAAEDLLQQANERRRERRWQEADRIYLRVHRAHPGTTAAYVAGVASAALHLEQLGDPRGALRLYRAALAARPRGSLAEEARYGIAEALRVLGEREGEAQALAAFVAAHPDSPLRTRAEQRLRALAAR